MPRHKHRKGSPLYVTPAFELFPDSFHRIKDNIWVFIPLYFFPLVIGLSNGFWIVDTRRHLVPDSLMGINAVGNATLPVWTWANFGIAFFFALAIGVVLQIMAHAAQLAAAKGQKVDPFKLVDVLKAKGWQMFFLYLATSFITLIGLILFIVPGIIMLRRYYLAPYVLLEHDHIDIWRATEKSAEISKRDSFSVYSIMGLMLLFSLFGIFPLIGWIAAFLLHFFYSAAPAMRYLELKRLG